MYTESVVNIKCVNIMLGFSLFYFSDNLIQETSACLIQQSPLCDVLNVTLTEMNSVFLEPRMSSCGKHSY